MNYLPLSSILPLWLMLFLSLKVQVHAQETAFVQLKEDPEFTIVSGEETYLQLSFHIREGYHIQANRVNDENLVPSVLTFNASDGLILGDPVFPQALEFRMKGEEEAWLVYSDVVEINVPVRVVETVDMGTYLVKGTLHYQACDHAKCYFPRDLPFSMKIKVE